MDNDDEMFEYVMGKVIIISGSKASISMSQKELYYVVQEELDVGTLQVHEHCFPVSVVGCHVRRMSQVCVHGQPHAKGVGTTPQI